MANVLDALTPVLYSAFRVVPRELTGFVNSVTTDFNDKGVAKGDSVKVPVYPAASAGDTTPAATFPTGSDNTPFTRDVTLDQARQVSWHLTAEEERSLLNGDNREDSIRQMFQQGIRTLVNEAEAYVANIAITNASRATGTAGTTPFGSDLSDAAKVKQILDDNGAPDDGMRSIIIDTNAGVNLRSLTQLTNVNEAGTDDLLRAGEIDNLFRMSIKESAGVVSHTKGTGTGYLVDGVQAVGTKTIAVTDGSGTILAGDIITHASDATNKYVVNTGVAAPGDIVIGAPGLQIAAADDDAITIGDSYVGNVGFHKSALCLVSRPALQPEGYWEQTVVSDPQTGLSMLFVRVPQDGQVSWFLRWVYDAFAPNKEYIATLLG